MTEEKEIELSFRKVKVKEIRFADLTKVDASNKEEASKKTLILGSDLTDTEYENLSAKDGLKLSIEINELNGFAEKVFR